MVRSVKHPGPSRRVGVTGRVALATLLVAGPLTAFEAWAQPRAGRLGRGARRIDFDTDASGEPIADRALLGDRYAAWGVRFGADDRATATDGLLVSGHNRALPGDDGVLEVSFSQGVRAVGAWGFDVVLEAFDAQGRRVARGEHTDGTAGLFGGARELGWVAVACPHPIVRVRFSRAYPDQRAYGFNVDDLWFVPVPARP